MNWTYLFLSFRGRISRTSFWLGILTVLGIASAAAFLAAILTSLLAGSRQGAADLLTAALTAIALAAFITTLAISVKRLHDRNKSSWWMALYCGVILVHVIAVKSGMMAPPGTPTWLSVAATAFDFMIVVYYLIDLGCLKGSDGPNSFGADPFGGEHVVDASF